MSKGSRLREQRRVQAPQSRNGRRPVRARHLVSNRAARVSRSTLYLAVGAAATLLAAALIGVSVLSRGDSGSAAPTTVVEGRATVKLFADIPQDGVVLGRPSAPVTLVEFADFQCPYCAAFAQDSLPEIVRKYVRTGRVRIEYRALAFIGPDSVEARKLALAAALQDRFWQYAHLLFENQGEENSGWLTEERVEATANAVPGLDVERALADSRTAAVVDEIVSAEDQATQFGISGTPSFLAGQTGGKLERIELESLDARALAPTLDRLLNE